MSIMNRQNRSIINNLLRNWSKNTVAVYALLKKQGIYRQLGVLDIEPPNGT